MKIKLIHLIMLSSTTEQIKNANVVFAQIVKKLNQ